MMILSVLTQLIVEEEILPTPMGTHGPKIRTTGMTMVDKKGLDLKETLQNTLKAIKTRLWISWSPSKGSWL
jgi:hypothetical protein